MQLKITTHRNMLFVVTIKRIYAKGKATITDLMKICDDKTRSGREKLEILKKREKEIKRELESSATRFDTQTIKDLKPEFEMNQRKQKDIMDKITPYASDQDGYHFEAGDPMLSEAFEDILMNLYHQGKVEPIIKLKNGLNGFDIG